MHVISGDLWAGAEVQAFTLLASLREMKDVAVEAVILNPGTLEQKLRAAGVPVLLLPEAELSAVQILRRLRRHFSRFDPDVVHTHRLKENVLGSIANRLSVRAICVRTVHGLDEHGPRGLFPLSKRLFRALDAWCAANLQDQLVAVSDDLAERIATIFPGGRVTVIHNGIDCRLVKSAIGPSDIRREAEAALHIGIVGRLEPVKRVDIFLNAAKRLVRSNPNQEWRFHVIGDGKLRGHLEDLAHKLGIADRVTFHGHRADSLSCISAMDALVMCSDHEGLPMTALEAVCLGTPLIAHAVGGLTEVTPKFPHGSLIAANDPGLYADAVCAIVAAGKPTQGTGLPQKFLASTNAAAVYSLYSRLQRETHAR